MIAELTLLLQSKLTESTAKAMSAILARNSSISLPYLNFLRNSGYHPRVKKFTLPPFVSDPFLYLTIVKQLFLATQSLTLLSYQIPSQKKFNPTEFFHPASFGFDFDCKGPPKPEEVVATGLPPSSFVGTRPLKRQDHVDAEIPEDTCDIYVIHPVFFHRGRRSILISRENNESDIRRLIWPQNEFTFLYNTIGPISNSALSKLTMKQVGQGLALIELVPDCALPIKTGSRSTLYNDTLWLSKLLSKGGLLYPFNAGGSVFDEEKELMCRTCRPFEEVWCKIFPTIPMSDEKLQAFCLGIFEHALFYYAIERLSALSTTNIPTIRNEDLPPTALPRRLSHASQPVDIVSAADVPRLIRTAQSQFPTNIPAQAGVGSVGVDFIPCVLQRSLAAQLILRVKAAILELCPNLKRSNRCACRSEDIFITSPLNNSSKTAALRWNNSPRAFSSSAVTFDTTCETCVLYGDLLLNYENEGKLGESSMATTSDLRMIPDDVTAVLPDWMRRRRLSLEVIVRPAGLYLLYYNISLSMVHQIRGLIDTAGACLAPIRRMRKAEEDANLGRMGLGFLCKKLVRRKADPKDLELLFSQLQRLSWEKKTVARLYLNFSPKQLKNKNAGIVSPLSTLDATLWRSGKPSSCLYLPMPDRIFKGKGDSAISLFENYRLDLLRALEHLDVDAFHDRTMNCLFIVAPIPNTNIVHTTELVFFEGASGYIMITERHQDVFDMLPKIAKTSALLSKADAYFFSPPSSSCAPSFATYHYQQYAPYSFRISGSVTNHSLLQSIRCILFHGALKVINHALMMTTMAEDALGYEFIQYAINCLRFFLPAFSYNDYPYLL